MVAFLNIQQSGVREFLRVGDAPGNRNTIHIAMRKHNNKNYGAGRVFLAGAAILLLVVMGCDNTTSPNQDLTRSHDIPVTMNSGDATNSTIEELPIYTADGFYFLPPMVKDSEYSGTFDAGLSPVVEICKTPACDEFHAIFDMDGGGSEQVRVDEEDEHYIVNWNTNSSGAMAGQTYRVRVLVNDLVLGHADIAVVTTGREAVEVRSDGLIALVANQTLPVKFRVEEDIADGDISIEVIPASAEITIGVDAIQLEAIVRDESGSEIEDAQVTWSTEQNDIIFLVTEPIEGFDVEPGFMFGITPGSALVTATFDGISASSSITVFPAPCEARGSGPIRFGNLSPVDPVVDVAVDGVPLGLELEFGDVSDYIEISGCTFTFVEAENSEVEVSPSRTIFPPIGTANSFLLVGTQDDVDAPDRIYMIEEDEGLGFWEDGFDVDFSLTYVQPCHAAVAVDYLAAKLVSGTFNSGALFPWSYLNCGDFLLAVDASSGDLKLEVDLDADGTADTIFPLPELSPGEINQAIFVTDSGGNLFAAILPPNEPVILISPEAP